MATTPSVSVLVVIFTVNGDDLKVLLIHRSADPFEGYWAIPGGFLAEGENLDEAAVRKLSDETGLSDVYLEQLYTFHNLDNRSGVAVTYFALVHHQNAQLAPREAWRPAWFTVGDLPPLAFHNDQVIDYALRRLRAKLDYTNVVYSLLPEYFTLSQLQRVYESILNRKLDKRNFRKRMLSLGLVAATDRRLTDGAHRPAQLYAFKERQPVII
jgi:8-oxo-dGTP diphosphatase